MNRGVWEKHEGKRPSARPKHRQQYNKKLILKKQERTVWIGFMRLMTGTRAEIL